MRQPIGEYICCSRVLGADHVHEAVIDGLAQERALVCAMANGTRFDLRWMQVGVDERHIEIAAQHEPLAECLPRRRPRREIAQERTIG